MNDEMQGQNHAAYLWPDGLHYTEPPDSTTEAFQNWIRDVVAQRDRLREALENMPDLIIEVRTPQEREAWISWKRATFNPDGSLRATLQEAGDD